MSESENNPRRLSPGTRLVLRLMVVYLGVTAAVAALAIETASRSQRAQLIGEVAKRGEAISGVFVLSVTEPLHALDVDSLLGWIGHLLKLPDINRVLIFDSQGRTITDGTGENPYLGEVLAGAREALKARDLKPVKTQTDDRLSFIVPVRLHDQKLGGVQLELGLHSVARELAESRRQMWVTLLLAVALGTIPVWFVSNFIIKPFFVGGR